MNKIKDILKILGISISLVLVVLLLSGINLARESTIITGQEGSSIINNPTSAPIVDLVNNHGSLKSDGQSVGNNVFLSTGEFHNPSIKPYFYGLFCCGYGVRLTTEWSSDGAIDYSTKVLVGLIKTLNGHNLAYTDSGRHLALLYGDHLSSGTTVGEGDERFVVRVTETTQKEEEASKKAAADLALAKAKAEIWGEDIKTITYGYYQYGGIEKATPAEAYVLQYMKPNPNNQDPDSDGNTYRNNHIQVAWWAAKANSSDSAGTPIDAGGSTPDEEEPEEEPDEVTPDEDGGTDADEPSEEEQEDIYETTEEDSSDGNDLYQEAMAFQGYIIELANAENGERGVHNYTGGDLKNMYDGKVFDVNYEDSMKPIDNSDVDVLYDSITNTYRIGPLKMNYIRAGAQYGDRLAVDFAGVSKATLKLKDVDGNTTEMVLDQSFYNGTKGFRFVYDHERDMRYYDVNDYADFKEGENFYYPYPYDDEIFYLEIDYKEDITSVEELKFDFHWINGGAEYENLMTGTAYKVSWHVAVEYKETVGHADGGHYHGSGKYKTWVSPCHTHKHISWTFDFYTYVEYDSHESLISQPFIKCEEVVMGNNDPNLSESNPNMSGAKSISMSAGGWDLTTEIAGFAWVEGITYEKGTIIDDPDNEGASKWDGSTGSGGNQYESDWRKQNIEVRVMRVVYEKTGDTYTEVRRELAKAYKTKTTEAEGTVLLSDQYDWDGTRLYTDSNGEYKIYLLIPSVEDKTPNQMVSYDIEFIYDGQTYEAVEYLVSADGDTAEAKLQEFKSVANGAGTVDYSKYKDDSYVIENSDPYAVNTPVAGGRNTIPLGRLNFDNNFYEIYGGEDSAFKDDMSSKGYANDQYHGSELELDYKGQTYKEFLDEVGSTMPDGDILQDENSRIKTSLITEDESQFVIEQYQLASRTSTASLLLPYTERIYIRNYQGETAIDDMKDVAQLEENKGQILDGEESFYYPFYEYFHQVNLGLIRREDVDVSVAKDLYKSTVVVNQQQVTYKYSTLKDYENLDDDKKEYLNTLLEIQNIKQEYELGLYAADFYYRSSVYGEANTKAGKIIEKWKDDSELKIFVTYKMQVYNDSKTADVTINRIDDYYDSTFTLVKEDVLTDIIDTEGNKSKELVAEQPYYRIYSLLGSDISNGIYHYNSEDDLAEISNLSRSSSASGSTRDIAQSAGKIEPGEWITNDEQTYGNNGSYKKSILEKFKYTEKSEDYVDETNEFVLSPGERIELFVTYEVDQEGYLAASGYDFGDESFNESQSYEEGKESLYNTRAKLLGGKNNVIEVGNFSSFYTTEGIRFNTSAYKPQEVNGMADADSAPGNVNLYKTKVVEADGEKVQAETLDKTWFDDDIESAPIFRIYIRGEKELRKIDGVSWLDKDDADIDGYNTATANGIYDSGEEGIDGLTVSLVEKVRAPAPDSEDTENLLEYEFVWPDSISSVMEKYNPVTSTSGGGKYAFENFPAGVYVVRFEYGNTEATTKYNGQDYENTSYQVGMINDGDYNEAEIQNCDTRYQVGEENLNNEWHDLGDNEAAKKLEETRVSDARDYEPQRLRVIAYSRTISNSIGEVLAANEKNTLDTNQEELIAGTAMVANTAKLNFEVERVSEIDYTKYNSAESGGDDSGTQKIKFTKGVSKQDVDEMTQQEPHVYYAENIDFGLEERAQNSIQLDKFLKTIVLTKEENSEEVLRVQINDDESMVLSSEDSQAIPKILMVAQSNGVQGFKYITMESSFLENLTVTLTYRIDVINESEVDWTSKELSEKYTAKELREIADNIEGNHGDESRHTAIVTGEGISYGEHAGYYYYTNKSIEGTTQPSTVAKESDADITYEDMVVKTTVDQLVEYIDPDIELAETSKNLEANNSWTNSLNYDGYDYTDKITTLDGLISDESYTIADDEGTKYYLQDNMGNLYISETRSNIAFSTSDVIKKEYEEGNSEKKGRIYEVHTRNSNGSRKVDDTGWGFVKEEKQRQNAYGYVINSGTTNHINVHNSSLTKELLPWSYARSDGEEVEYQSLEEADEKGERGHIYVTTSVTTTSSNSADNMNYNNLSEVLVYSNTVGRRTFMEEHNDTEAHTTIKSPTEEDETKPTIPGNANELAKLDTVGNVGGIWNAGHSSNLAKPDDETDTIKLAEIDADAPEYVTFTEPTGIRQIDLMKTQHLIIALGIMSIIGLGIVGITIKIVIDKRRLA